MKNIKLSKLDKIYILYLYYMFNVCKGSLKPKYIIRNKDNMLYLYCRVPSKNIQNGKWYSISGYSYRPSSTDDLRLKFIKWEDTKPWKINDLIKSAMEGL